MWSSGQIFVIALCADHGAVIAAETEWGHTQADTEPLRLARELTPDAGIGRDAARDGKCLIACFL